MNTNLNIQFTNFNSADQRAVADRLPIDHDYALIPAHIWRAINVAFRDDTLFADVTARLRDDARNNPAHLVTITRR